MTIDDFLTTKGESPLLPSEIIEATGHPENTTNPNASSYDAATKTGNGEGLNETIELENGTFPKKVEDIKRFAYLGGSSGVELGSWNEKMYVVKKARVMAEGTNNEQLIEEYIADRIYEAFGYAVPNSKIYNGGEYKIGAYIPGKDMNAFPGKTDEYRNIQKEVQRGFALDALLANWDVIGSSAGDNIRLGDDGRVYRIDNGGALRFRARGAKKGDAFGAEVGELESLRKLHRVYKGITEKEVVSQIQELVSKRERVLTAVDNAAQALGIQTEAFDELKITLNKRLDFLESLTMGRDEKSKSREKGEYESLVTNQYFELWEDVKLVGNPEILTVIKQNIINAEKRNEDRYIWAAEKLHIPIDELKERLQTTVERIVENAYFFRATRVDLLEKIMLEDGRWKSQFETGTSEGSLDQEYRMHAEHKMFGYQLDVDGNREQRPIYGYFSDNKNGVINYDGSEISPNHVASYGTVNFRLRRENALQKATITFDDSLSNNQRVPPTPAAKPHFSSCQISSYDIEKFLADSSEASKPDWGSYYTEVQYHGQLTMDDVESIHVSRKNRMDDDDIRIVHEVVDRYNKLHPEKPIPVYEY